MNESKSLETRHILEELTCYLKTDPASELLTEEPYIPYNMGTAQYDLYVDNEVSRQDDSPGRLQNPDIRRFSQIPAGELPCPKKQEATEPPYIYLNTPKYAEINSGCSCLHVCMFQIILTILYCLT